MKKSLILLLAILCVSTIWGQTGQKVAVYVTGADGDGINEFIGAYLVDAIVNGSDYQAVERTADFIRELNKEQDYQRTGAVNDDQISLLGQQFGVQLVCIAKVGVMGDRQFVSARLIDVETATVKSSTKPVIFTMDDIDISCSAVAISLVSGNPVEIKQPTLTSNTDNIKKQGGQASARTTTASSSTVSTQNSRMLTPSSSPEDYKEITITCEKFPLFSSLAGKIEGIVEIFFDDECIWNEDYQEKIWIKINDANVGTHTLRISVRAFKGDTEIPIIGGTGGVFKINTLEKQYYELKTNAFNYKVKMKK